MLKVFMTKILHRLLPLMVGICLVAGGNAAAEEQDANVERIRNSLAVFLPELAVDQIKPSAMPGLYEAVVDSSLVYVSADGRFLLQGAVFDLEQGRDITKPRLAALRVEAIEAIGEENLLIYEPEQTRYTVTVFTDIDCSYCRKLHVEMPDYLANGIRIRYAFYPRAGLDSPSYAKAVSVWCAEDRHAAMDDAKRGRPVQDKRCDNPVAQHMKVGEKLPVRGTPTLVLAGGEVISGYRPAAELRMILDQLQAQQQQAQQP
jgi:thiol:disulfide interchange protein DsbC